MSTPVGSENQFVDTQDVQVENVTDGLIFKQVMSANPVEVNHIVDLNRLRDNRVEKLFDLTDAKWDIRLLLTEPEFNALFTLSIPVSGVLSIKEWKITMKSQSGTSVNIKGDASLAMLRVMDTGVGVVEITLRLEFMSGTGTEVITVT